MAFLPSDEFFCLEHPVAEEAYVQLAVLTKVRKFNQSEFFTVENPDKLAEGTFARDRHILVDAVSIKESGKLQPVVTSPKDYGMPPLPLPPGKSSFLSYSLPGSATSSPKFSTAAPKKKPQSHALNPLGRQQTHALNHSQRSNSSGEGKIFALDDGLDQSLSNPWRTETRNDQLKKVQNNLDSQDDNFRCGAMCLYLPGFGKAKPVRSRKEEPELVNVISRTVSLEKFECASWTSSAIIHDNEGGNSSKFFDLPLELIQCSDNDKHLPVRAAFVFEKERKGTKNSSTKRISRKSHELSSQVRVSSSFRAPRHSTVTSPCISPRLQKARDDFNAFLKAADN
ncbi:hypothetical protein DCAR_0104700 [Daucus carota subsp. sativus]|uniref:Uncharacterized protein n=1 Tax=Daucus carota subsp. sativus TaxID=79200 RepID=A0A166J186_DAUCS|nr:hypothetical protein DCAR_0104700 [Daucus carota subsp. sativus]